MKLNYQHGRIWVMSKFEVVNLLEDIIDELITISKDGGANYHIGINKAIEIIKNHIKALDKRE
jgi:hypothetical protein